MYREQCSKWAGLSTQTAISTESAHQNDLTRCAVYTQYVILRRPRCVPFSTLNEWVPRTFHSARNMNARVPRTCSKNILPGLCTENIYQRAPSLLENYTHSTVQRVYNCSQSQVYYCLQLDISIQKDTPLRALGVCKQCPQVFFCRALKCLWCPVSLNT